MYSIIIPLYNCEYYIEKTIASVLSQSCQDFEIIVIDDYSTDNSFGVVSCMAEKDSRINILKNDKNYGFCKTANIGVSKANGDLIIVLGQDDLLDPKHLEKMKMVFDETSIVASYCDEIRIDENDSICSKGRYRGEELFTRDFIKRNSLYSCGLTIRKKSFIDVGGYPEFKKWPQYGEWYLWIKLSKIGRIVRCKDLSSYYRRHSSNLTNTFKNKHTKLKLEKYWNKCRCLAICSDNIRFKDRINGVAYILYRHLYMIKVFLFG